MDSNMDPTAILALTCAGLLVFGMLYDAWVARVNRLPGSEGYTSLLVVIGVGVTVVATLPLIGGEAFIHVILAFVASGAPMIYGSIKRHLEARAREDQALRDQAQHIIDQQRHA